MLFSCNKDFLDAKPSKSLVVPAKLQDLQGMLDYKGVMGFEERSVQELASGDFYLPDDLFLQYEELVQQVYTWDDNELLNLGDWRDGYQRIFYANNIIDVANTLEPETELDKSMHQNILGAAYYFRSSSFWDILQGFAPAYDVATAGNEMGIVLPLSSDAQARYPRSDLETCYQQVINDLKRAIPMLPLTVEHNSRPSRAAGYGMMARVYLSMGKYSQSLAYSDSAIQFHPALLDFNTLNKATENANPFTLENEELIINSFMASYGAYSATGGYVDTVLYDLYSTDDLRKTMYFGANGTGYTITGRFSGVYYPLSGLATGEMYLIRAESKVRTSDIAGGMDDLNTLLEKRWRTGTLNPYTAGTETAALNIILEERRKELVLRGLRWSDLKRLNSDPRFAVTLRRTVQGVEYTLPPGDNRYQFLIPLTEIQGNPQVEQNPR